MWRFVVTKWSVAALALVLVSIHAALSAEGRFYFEVGLQLVLVIGGVMVTAAFFTVIYLLTFGILGRRLIGDRFPLFVGWNLLRSHRVTPKISSKLRLMTQHMLKGAKTRWGVAILLSVLAIAASLWLFTTGGWNALAEATTPAVASVGRYALGLTGVLGILAAGPPLALKPRRGSHVAELKIRTNVTLPTFISILGVALGVWALIVVLSVMHGFAGDLQAKILRTNAHISIEPAVTSGQGGVLGDGLTLEDQIRAIEGVAEAHAYVHGEVMMASSTNIAVNVMVKGMDDEAFDTSEQLRGYITSGGSEWMRRPEALLSDRHRYPVELQFESGSGIGDGVDLVGSSGVGVRDEPVYPPIMLGAELATTLNVSVGAEIQIISPDGDIGPTGLRPKLKNFRVAGIFRTGMYEYDQKLAYMSIDDAQRFFILGNDLNRLEVRLDTTDDTQRVMAAIGALLPDHLRASEWQERNKSLFSALELERVAMFIVLGFIILVASLLIVSSLVMIIVEKSRDIAVLKALGASSRGIVKTFLVIGSVIGAIGTASGLTLGVGTCLIIDKVGIALPQEYYIPSLPVQLDPVEVTAVGVAAFLVCILATAYPSWVASRMRPVEGFRHG